MQGQQVLKDGIGRGSEVEEDIDPKLARTFLSDPDRILDLDSQILQPLLKSVTFFVWVQMCRCREGTAQWRYAWSH